MAKNEYQVDLNNMRLFVSVVQAGSLTKAAELLNIPKSHLSRHLTELETSLGTRLMERGRQGIRLNALGQRFLHNAQEMLSMALLAHFNQEAYSNLVRLLPDWTIEKVPLYAVYYKNRGSAPTVRSMVECLVKEQKMSK
ncbi:MAG: LysR family transcriptional regulator [[Pasteurella] aerogenes]|nr:LysR family transcriptional regulator [[Pasteurella] aerogenes]